MPSVFDPGFFDPPALPSQLPQDEDGKIAHDYDDTAGNTLTATFPDSQIATAGTLLIALYFWSDGDGAAPALPTAPTGYTTLYSQQTSAPVNNFSLFYKIADGTETSVTIGAGGALTFFEVTGVNNSNPITAFAINNAESTTGVRVPSGTGTLAVSPSTALVMGHWGYSDGDHFVNAGSQLAMVAGTNDANDFYTGQVGSPGEEFHTFTSWAQVSNQSSQAIQYTPNNTTTEGNVAALWVINLDPDLESVGRDLELQNSIQESVGNNVELQNAIVEFVSADLELRNLLLQFAGNNLELQTSIVEFSGNDFEIQNRILAFAGNNVELQNRILQFAGNSVELQNRILQFAGRNVEFQNSIVEFVSADLELQNTILQFTGNTFELQNEIFEFVSADLELQNSIGGLTAVGRSLELQNTIQQFAGRNLELQNSLVEFVGIDVELQNSLLEFVFKDLELRNSIGEPVDTEFSGRITVTSLDARFEVTSLDGQVTIVELDINPFD